MGTLYYQLRDIKIGQILKKASYEASDSNEQFFTIPFTDQPSGDYNLTVWGNMYSDDTTGVLHSNGSELTDLYVANKNISFSPESPTDQLMLEGVKGDFLLVCLDFPSGITRV